MNPVSVIGGSGELGFGLALRLGHAGIPIVIGSRDVERAQEAVGRLRGRVPAGRFEAADNATAAERGHIVVLSVPFASHEKTLRALSRTLSPGQILVDATVPLASAVGGAPTRMLGVWQGSAAQQAAEIVPDGVGVVAALHTIAAGHLKDLAHPLEQDVLVTGDSLAEKRAVAELLHNIPGLRCVDCGALEMARVTEQLTPLLINLNLHYKVKSGLRIAGLPDELWA